MKYSMIVAAGLAMAGSGLAFAEGAKLDGAKLFQERTCWSCHGKDGKTPILPEYPRIAGQNEKYVERQMIDIKSGARSNGNSAAMKGVMVIVADPEIKAIAEYVSKMPR